MAGASAVHEVFPQGQDASAPIGIRVGDLVFVTGLSHENDGQAADLETQVHSVFRQMLALVAAEGGDAHNIARVTAYVTEVEHREPVNGLWWHEVFPDPDDRPAYKVLLGELGPGELVRLDVMAVLRASRRRIAIPNITSHDPSIVIGDYVISSRWHGNDKTAGGRIVDGGLRAEAERTFINLIELAEIAGGNASSILQINTYGRSETYRPVVRASFDEAFAGRTPKPVLNMLVNFVSPRMNVAADMIAMLDHPQ